VLYRAKGVPAWNRPIVVAAFFSSALTMGTGVCLIISPGLTLIINSRSRLAMSAVAAADAFIWMLHARGQSAAKSEVIPVGLTRLIPAIILAALSAAQVSTAPSLGMALGAVLLVGGVLQKRHMISGRGYFRSLS
jgi:hypothetical protein